MACTSKNTNVNVLPAVANLVEKKFGWRSGTRNLDIGSGRYNKLTAYLQGKGVSNLPYDPYNRPDATNRATLASVAELRANTCVLSNVLNVIETPEMRHRLLLLAKRFTSTTGHVYITVYEGNRSGKGCLSKHDCWQENRRTADYVDEVHTVFRHVQRFGKLIVASSSLRATERTEMPEHLKSVLKFMERDLRLNRLSVCLVAAPEEMHSGHKVRVADSSNPEWYQRLCSRYGSRSKSHRRWRTRIKRRNVLSVLRTMLNKGYTYSPYGEVLCELAQDLMDEWAEEEAEYWEQVIPY